MAALLLDSSPDDSNLKPLLKTTAHGRSGPSAGPCEPVQKAPGFHTGNAQQREVSSCKIAQPGLGLQHRAVRLPAAETLHCDAKFTDRHPHGSSLGATAFLCSRERASILLFSGIPKNSWKRPKNPKQKARIAK